MCELYVVFKVRSWADLASLTSILWYVGPRLAYRPLIMTKLVRLITAFYREQPKGPDGSPADSTGKNETKFKKKSLITYQEAL